MGLLAASGCFIDLLGLLGDGTTEPDTTIQVQGTVTAADDGSPITGASVEVFVPGFGFGPTEVRTRVQTNNQGDYSLSFIEMGFCPESLFRISVSAQGFQSVTQSSHSVFIANLFVGPDTTHVRCTNEQQTIDFQLMRI